MSYHVQAKLGGGGSVKAGGGGDTGSPQEGGCTNARALVGIGAVLSSPWLMPVGGETSP